MRTKTNISRTVHRSAMLGVCVAMLISAASYAEGGRKQGRKGPPPEAIEACVGLEAEQACQFTSPRGDEVSGQCFAPPRDEAELACRPERDSNRSREEGEPDDV